VNERLADLVADFSLIGAGRFNIVLIKHDVIRSCGEVEDSPEFRHPQLLQGKMRLPVFSRDSAIRSSLSSLIRQAKE
jgi:hypothetical protein